MIHTFTGLINLMCGKERIQRKSAVRTLNENKGLTHFSFKNIKEGNKGYSARDQVRAGEKLSQRMHKLICSKVLVMMIKG